MEYSLQQLDWKRRHCIALTAALVANGACGLGYAAQFDKAPVRSKVILVLGDSLSAEYGLKRGTGWVALLRNKLDAEKISTQVINASISGDTTSGGRARLAALLTMHRPALLVIELGANDALRGLPLELTQENLSAMAVQAKKNGAKVLLLGMQIPPNYGQNHATRFAKLFAVVAKSQQTGLVPFLLKGVADAPDAIQWFQADRIHPTEAAQPRLLRNVWPELVRLLP